MPDGSRKTRFDALPEDIRRSLTQLKTSLDQFIMEPEQRESPLSDRDYQELIESRVRENLRVERRWRIGIGITIVVGLLAVFLQVSRQDNRIAGFEPLAIEVSQRPYINNLATPFAQAQRLVIEGTAFGSSPGSVELYYRASAGTALDDQDQRTGTQTVTMILQGERIEEWTESEIIVTTTQAQRRQLLESIGASNFGNLVPYIRVVTAGRQRSPVW